LASRLRELPDVPSMRLIAVTGYGQESDRRRTRQAGFHHHLVKPVDLRAVDEVLTRMAVENSGGEECGSLQ
jgi:CheY-like chemotaxis protein